MAEIVVMSKMNLTMEEGVLVEWYKSENDLVELDEPICSIENEKTAEDMLSPASGRIVKIWGEIGTNYEIGVPLALIALPEEDVSEIIKNIENGQFSKSNENVADESIEDSIPISKVPAAPVKIMPKVRKRAEQNNVTVDELLDFIEGDRITDADLDKYLEKNLKKDVKIKKASAMRKTIAKNMSQSCEKTARLTNFMEIDLTAVMERVRVEKEAGKDISFTALIIKACSIAMQSNEIINTFYDEEKQEILFYKKINIGCAVDVPEGLVVPVIKNTQSKTVEEISIEIRKLVKAAKESKLNEQDMQGGTFTVSNVGMFGVDSFTPIINYPQSAILGVGTINVLPRYIDESYESIAPRKIMKAGLTYNHKVIDGAPASRFLQKIKLLLEQVDELF